MAKVPQFFNLIADLRRRYYEALPGKESLIQIIGETEIPEHVYNSNAIENSTLSLEETDRILLEIDLDRFITQRELFEAKNLARVAAYIQTKAKQTEATLDLMLLLHKMLLSNIRDEIAGRFRNNDEWVKVGNHIAPDPKEVLHRLERMLITYQSNPGENIISRVSRQHLEFEFVHPFVDGNGRIGRLLINYFLIREGYVPVNIKYSNRSDYYAAFEAFQRKSDTSIMETIVGKALTNSYHKRLAYLEGKEIVSLKEYSKKIGTSHSNLINKAQRQTIEAFSEKGIWKIGI